MSKTAQVAESRMALVWKRIKEAFEPLLMSDYVTDTEIENEVEKIVAAQDGKKIEKLVNQTETVYIPLDESSIVKKAKVSEKAAQKQADKVKEEKIKTKESAQKQREE